MKKLYTILGLSTLFFGANAQQAQKQTGFKRDNTINSFLDLKSNGNNSVAAATCYTVTTITTNDTLTLYTVPTSTACATGGYVAGNNCYGDAAKATFIPGALVPATGQITGVIAVLYQKSPTIGTHGTHTVSVDILNGDTTNGPSGAAVATATASMITITTTTATNSEITYLFNLPAPVAAPAAGFFASLNLPTTSGDTTVLFCTRNRSNHHNYAWDKNGTSWLAFSNPNDWGLQGSLTLMPVICVTTTGIHNNTLEASMALFPNPSNGEFNFAVALPVVTNLTIHVVNTLGQVMFNKTENNISHGTLHYDFSSLGKGVYFVNITDSQNNKVVKKIVVE